MRRKYTITCNLVDTEAEAKAFCERENCTGSYYKRKTYPATYTKWSALDGGFRGYVCWYYY